jgi:hypothetical protein
VARKLNYQRLHWQEVIELTGVAEGVFDRWLKKGYLVPSDEGCYTFAQVAAAVKEHGLKVSRDFRNLMSAMG